MIFRRPKKANVPEEETSTGPTSPDLQSTAPDGDGQGEPEVVSAPAPPVSPALALSPKFEGTRKMPDYPTPSASASPLGPSLSPPGQAPRRAAVPAVPSPGGRPEQEGKRLTVGKDISLSGEINSCDILTVEGRVDASLIGGRVIEVADGGFFKGNAEIDVAEIAGVYEGDLTVREKLTIRATGQIKGRIRYRKIEIDLGGTIIGEMELFQS